MDLASSDIEVECAACGVVMTAQVGGGGTIRYFHCPRCNRWVSSTYAEVLQSDAKFRARERTPAERATKADFGEIKNRLERWLSALDDQDPYRILGVSPLDSTEKLKARFRELALECHPDRGGSAERMREINLAYERVCAHRARRQSGAPGSAALPASSR